MPAIGDKLAAVDPDGIDSGVSSGEDPAIEKAVVGSSGKRGVPGVERDQACGRATRYRGLVAAKRGGPARHGGREQGTACRRARGRHDVAGAQGEALRIFEL